MSRLSGVDIGTGNICVCESQGEEKELFKVKDAFFKLDPKNFIGGNDIVFGEKMLKKSGANFIKVDGVLFVLGDDAFKFANLFHKECLRPMAKGVLNPNEPVSSLMVKALIEGVAGSAKADDDILWYCVPANPIDDDFDIIYHKNVLNDIFVELGYKNINQMTEGLAVVYSELEDTSFTGIGMSFGAGMVNVAYSFLGLPVFSFSITKSGDWIDINAAKAVNETANVVQATKENGVDLLNPKNPVEKAICVYYEALLKYVVEKFVGLYTQTDKKNLPNINQPIDVVVAGGTSMAINFDKCLLEKVKEFPVPIGKVRTPEEPLFAVCKGLYNASAVSGEDEK